ncbi:selenocysteine-specific translation elongation factor [Clostridium sardiniense]|uniref:selenocysteine-specific translation elongation factor n=1 Tax=Clostridium sardiniense TaxID=29369 RepID=UPI00195DF4E0|nr:selenocysteine-specific translation elongation factor [Clostridium sardiniense]MBM7836157.1 selenocysteine-specific elongation factor [Clostridium sardiniense]
MKTLMIGTCGHIDHGKTSLIKELTGVDTDRLEEEKRRGITIDLGFTDLILKSKRRVAFVDVPGHEKFIRNMIAGITGVDTVLFVIAADEGIMPQTIEHLEIINGLNIKNGVIALTKCDKSDEELIQLIIDDIREAFKGSILENARIIKTSTKTKEGIQELIDFFERTLDNKKENDLYDLQFRMCIDRVFSIKGSGTVVTGTALEGEVREGDILKLYPSNKVVRVREIQSYGKKESIGVCGNRCAINLTGIAKDDIKRGEVISSEEDMEASFILDCSFNITNNKVHNIKNRQRVRVYHGTKEVMGRIYIFDEDKKYVQIRLEEGIVSKKGDYYYLRNYSPMYNIGGGRVIEPNGNKIRESNKLYLDNIILKEKGSLEDNILDRLGKEEFLYTSELFNMNDSNKTNIDEAIEKSLYRKKVVIIENCKENIIFSVKQLGIIKDELLESLSDYHNKNPLEIGMPKESLRKIIIKKDIKSKEFNEILKLLNKDEVMTISGEIISLSNFKRRLNLNQKNFKRDLLKELEIGFINVDLDFIKQRNNISELEHKKIINILEQEGEILQLNDDVIIKVEVFNYGVLKVKEYLKDKGEITLGECRDILKTNRKIALAFLEELDCRKITKRVENRRVML